MSREGHTCHARGCDKLVPPSMFMCRRHWFMLPRHMQDEVWEVYVPGQEIRMDPTEEYIEVTTRIIDWLATKEKVA